MLMSLMMALTLSAPSPAPMNSFAAPFLMMADVELHHAVDGGLTMVADVDGASMGGPAVDILKLGFRMWNGNDCKALMRGSDSYCSTGDCKALLRKSDSYCDTDDCKAVLRGSDSYCRTGDCKAVLRKSDSYCDSGDCKAYLRKSDSYCETSSCKAFLRGSDSYCR